MKVPLLDVNAQNFPLSQEFQDAFERVFKSGQFIMGEDVRAFEAEIEQEHQVAHALAVSSGTDAILLGLMALGIQAGDEVLVPSFTFFATAGCVARLGAIPVFVDVTEEGFHLDLEDAEKKVTTRTKAIIPVHLYGQSVDMDAMMAFAEKHGLWVIEDAAQAIGATFRSQPVGGLGHCGVYSFFPSKNLGALGDAGMFVTQDAVLAEKAKFLRNHGMNPKYYHAYVGGNFRLDTLQCAFLRIKARHLKGYAQARAANALAYQQAFSGISENELILPKELENRSHTWNQFTLRVIQEGKREELRAFLSSREIGHEVYYPLALEQQACFQSLPPEAIQACETSQKLARQVISIPVYPELPESMRAWVIESIQEFFQA